MSDAKIVVEAIVALIKMGKVDLATALCENFVPKEEVDESSLPKAAVSKKKMDTLIANVNIDEVIGDCLKLKEGSFYHGTCPFCEDPGESFVVLYHHYCCDRCGAYGNALQFLMQTKMMSFHDCYKQLVDTYGDE